MTTSRECCGAAMTAKTSKTAKSATIISMAFQWQRADLSRLPSGARAYYPRGSGVSVGPGPIWPCRRFAYSYCGGHGLEPPGRCPSWGPTDASGPSVTEAIVQSAAGGGVPLTPPPHFVRAQATASIARKPNT
jgi:hypothetical protein